MKIEKLTYARRFNMGNYEHEEIGIEMFLEDGESFTAAHEALSKARKLIMMNSTDYLRKKRDAEKAKEGSK